MTTSHSSVQKQYEDHRRLQTRIEFHQQYTLNSTSLSEFLLPRISFTPHDHVLDAGCGTGLIFLPLVNQNWSPQARLVGLDQSFKVLSYLEQNLPPNHAPIQLECEDIGERL